MRVCIGVFLSIFSAFLLLGCGRRDIDKTESAVIVQEPLQEPAVEPPKESVTQTPDTDKLDAHQAAIAIRDQRLSEEKPIIDRLKVDPEVRRLISAGDSMKLRDYLLEKHPDVISQIARIWNITNEKFALGLLIMRITRVEDVKEPGPERF